MAQDGDLRAMLCEFMATKRRLAMLAGTAIGAAAVTGLHAQAKPPDLVTEIDVTNPDGHARKLRPFARDGPDILSFHAAFVHFRSLIPATTSVALSMIAIMSPTPRPPAGDHSADSAASACEAKAPRSTRSRI